jgi:hypothetical protein
VNLLLGVLVSWWFKIFSRRRKSGPIHEPRD